MYVCIHIYIYIYAHVYTYIYVYILYITVSEFNGYAFKCDPRFQRLGYQTMYGMLNFTGWSFIGNTSSKLIPVKLRLQVPVQDASRYRCGQFSQIHSLTHSLTGARQPEGCIGGESVRVGFMPPRVLINAVRKISIRGSRIPEPWLILT